MKNKLYRLVIYQYKDKIHNELYQFKNRTEAYYFGLGMFKAFELLKDPEPSGWTITLEEQ
jgi:hypothetical protein